MIVSVIVPIYKVERFIRRCAESLMEQTIKDEAEYIFVDDCTPDKSMEILKSVVSAYPEKEKQVKIVTHEHNKGLPAARNTGLTYARGKYVFHCDSDDWLERDTLEQLVDIAEQTSADIVWCDWFLSFEHNERYMKQPRYNMSDDALRGILRGRMKYNVWNKLVRRDLYANNNIRFPEGHGMGEDMTMIRLFACAKHVAHLPKALYHYVKTNNTAFTNAMSEKHLADVLYNTNETIAFITERKGETIGLDLAHFKLSVKYPLIISDSRKSYEKWQELFPEANKYILDDKEASLRSRVLQYAAWKSQFWVLWLHYKLVYRVVYGLIYR